MKREVYSDYVKFKQKAYYGKLSSRKRLIDICPAWLLSRLYPVVRHFPRESYVLDVGSGSGMYSYICRTKFKCKVDSLEPYMHDAFGNDVIKNDIITFDKSAKYDRVFLFDVLEHFDMDEAQLVLNKCRSYIDDGGAILIKVPNAGSSLGLQSHFGDITHRMGYSDVGLEQMINHAGFEVIQKCYVNANLTPLRMLASLLALPYSLFKSLYLFSKGISPKTESIGLMFYVR